MVAYRGKSPKIQAFFTMLVYRDGRHQIGVKWHILAYAGISWHIFTTFAGNNMPRYAGISWHIIPCKSGKKSGKVQERTTQKKAHSLRNTNNLLLQFTIIIQHIL